MSDETAISEKPAEATIEIVTVGMEASQRTQVYFAQKFNRVTRSDWIYNIDSGKWMYWNGKFWQTDEKTMIINVCRKFLIKQLLDIRETYADETIKENLKVLVKLNNAHGITDILNIARAMVTKKEREFDLQDCCLNVQNGTLDLITGTLHPHNPGDFISKCCAVGFDKDAQCPAWENHIATTLDGDPELITNVQEILGYALFAGNPAAIFGVFVGSGRNGKSVTVDTIQRVLGTYAVSVNPNCLMDTGGNPGSDRLKMIGARLIIASEPGDTSKGRCSLDTGFIKTITGGDRISARRLYCESIEFQIGGLVILITNVLPQIRDQSVAMRERVWCVPFDHYFAPEDRNTGIKDILFAEGSGILNWLIEGYRRYAAKGRLVQSKKVLQQSEWYMDEEDSYTPFLNESGIVRRRGLSISATDFYHCYMDWCSSKSLNTPIRSINAFGRHMNARFQKSHTAQGTVYHGIGLAGQNKIGDVIDVSKS